MKRILMQMAIALTAVATAAVCGSTSSSHDLYLNGGNQYSKPQTFLSPTWEFCAQCHGDFRATNYISLSDGQNWGNLHNLHRFDMLDGDCSTCHTSPNRTPVFLSSSDGGTGLDPISCVGCHGRNEDMGPDSNRGAGLRQHHWNTGTTLCASCHDDADPANYTPVGENVLPSYYFLPDPDHPNKPTDPCNTQGEENYAGDLEGLDNDGDDLYDDNDPDCASGPSCPDTGTILAGVEFSGTFDDACGSDDVRWILQSTTFAAAFSPAPIQVRFDGVVPTGFNTLTLTMEGQPEFGNNAAFIQLRMWNFTTGSYEGLPFINQPDGNDNIYTFTRDNSGGDYTDINGNVRAEVTCAKTVNGPVRLQIDDVFWTVD